MELKKCYAKYDAYNGMRENIYQLEIIHNLLQQRHRVYVSAAEALRNGHLTRDIMDDTQLREVIRLMGHVGWVLPDSWLRAFSPVTTLWDESDELVAKCTIWVASHQEYVRWHMEAMWMPTPDTDLYTRVYVQDVVTDDTYTKQFNVQQCRGDHHQICNVISTSNRRCELSILGGTPPHCKYAISRTVSPLIISRIMNGSWLVDTARCVNISTQCPGLPFTERLICQPSLIRADDQCVLVWPTGRTYPVHKHFLKVSHPIHVPIKWAPIAIPEQHIKEIKLQAIHQQLVIDPNEPIDLEPLPPMYNTPHHHYYSAPIIGILIFVLILGGLMYCVYKKKYCFAKGVKDKICKAFPFDIPMIPLGSGLKPEKQTETKVDGKEVSHHSSNEALPWPRPV